MTLHTEGFDDFEATLKRLGDEFGYTEVNRRVLIPAAREAMASTLPTAEGLARAETGEMRNSLRIDARRPSERDKRSNYITANDAAIAVLSAKRSRVSLGEEFGTPKKSGHPFLRPALEREQAVVYRRLGTILAFKLDSYKAKKMRDKR